MKKNYAVLLVFLFWIKILSIGADSNDLNETMTMTTTTATTTINMTCGSDTKNNTPACNNRASHNSILFYCKNNGNFADESDSQVYWYCNVDDEGGFIAVRRRCPDEQYFCPQFQDCVYKSDVRCHTNIAMAKDKKYQNLDSSNDDDDDDDDNYNDDVDNNNKVMTTHGLPLKMYSHLDFYAPFEDASSMASEKRKTPVMYENVVRTKNNGTKAKSKILGLPGCLTTTKPLVISVKGNDGQLGNEAERGLKNIDFIRIDSPGNEERGSDSFKEASPKRDNNVETAGEFTNELEEKLGFREEPTKYPQYRVIDTNTFLCKREGFFPDPHSCTSFYLCHNRRNSRDVEAIKIVCPKDTAYDRILEKCTRQALAWCFESKPAIVGVRSDIYRVKKSPFHHKKTSFGFTCTDEGRFPDPFSCKNYHYCYRRGKKGFGSLKFSCPNNMLFDFKNGRCGPANTIDC